MVFGTDHCFKCQRHCPPLSSRPLMKRFPESMWKLGNGHVNNTAFGETYGGKSPQKSPKKTQNIHASARWEELFFVNILELKVCRWNYIDILLTWCHKCPSKEHQLWSPGITPRNISTGVPKWRTLWPSVFLHKLGTCRGILRVP